MKNLLEEGGIQLSKECLNISDYEFKILIYIYIMAADFVYIGTITDICNWLRIKQYTNNNKNIKNAIKLLSEKGYLEYKLEGRKWIMILNKQKIQGNITIRKVWIDTLRDFNRDEDNRKINSKISISWSKLLKVFIYIYARDYRNIITISEIADALGMSNTVVCTAIGVIETCEFEGIKCYKYVIREKKQSAQEIFYQNIGSEIGFMILFE